jgi:disulfide bond formation protein DsbB
MTRTGLIALAAGGSLAMLLAAFAFQHLGGLPPCKMCIWQRWPHGLAVVAGVLALAVAARPFAVLGMLAALTTAVIGFYHAGVEQGFWEGPATCTSGPVGGLSTEDLMEQIMTAPLVRCDEIPWELFGISMAGWNGLVSLVLAGFWALAVMRRT